MRDAKIHYAGGLVVPQGMRGAIRMLPGWPACCAGAPAERIRAAGRQTAEPDAVTCKRCVGMMQQAAALVTAAADGGL